MQGGNTLWLSNRKFANRYHRALRVQLTDPRNSARVWPLLDDGPAAGMPA
jgi:hypothetical protein